jgi:aminocarboxymuconate-semialdehyde decarboxylase
MCRAHNNAIAAIQRRYPERFIGTAIVPFDDLEESGREVRRAARELGLQAVLLPGNWLGQNFDAMELFPFWDTVNQLELPVFVHHIPQSCAGSLGDHVPRYPMVGMERMRRLHVGVYVGFGLEYAMACAALSIGGVLDEFPNLRFCFFEAGAGWLPYAMMGADRAFHIQHACSRTQTLPSTLLRKHCFTAVEASEHIPALVQMMGSENLFFGTDFPHAEYRELPNMVSAYTDREGLTEDDKDNILGRTMLRVLRRE